MKAVFISDAHLRKSDDERYKKLMIFFDALGNGKIHNLVHPDHKTQEVCLIDDLYIAGDLFDFWLCTGGKINPEFMPAVHKLIDLQKAGIRIHLGEGNHDFFMADYFQGVLGMNVFEEMTEAKLDHLNVLIAHGDTTDKSNRGYLFLRRMLRSRGFYNLQRFIPAPLLWALAGLSSTASKELTVEDGDILVKKMSAYALKKFQEGYDAVILGHSHVPNISYYTVNDKKCAFVTLGDWITHYSFVYYENNNFSLCRYR